ncbi:MAG: hypothetical protein AAFZ38_00375 [Myxococcota bacterium]
MVVERAYKIDEVGVLLHRDSPTPGTRASAAKPRRCARPCSTSSVVVTLVAIPSSASTLAYLFRIARDGHLTKLRFVPAHPQSVAVAMITVIKARDGLIATMRSSHVWQSIRYSPTVRVRL